MTADKKTKGPLFAESLISNGYCIIACLAVAGTILYISLITGILWQGYAYFRKSCDRTNVSRMKWNLMIRVLFALSAMAGMELNPSSVVPRNMESQISASRCYVIFEHIWNCVDLLLVYVYIVGEGALSWRQQKCPRLLGSISLTACNNFRICERILKKLRI
jgi:hypothetical protein